jgi:hypothetical protein
MHADADIPVSGQVRLAGVQAHTNLDLHVVLPAGSSEPALYGGRGRNRIRGPFEGEEEPIALSVYLHASVLGDRPPNEVAMFGQHGAVALSQVLHELGRATDVREEQRDGSAWKLRHWSPHLPSSRADLGEYDRDDGRRFDDW